jgi:hypothetical protein
MIQGAEMIRRLLVIAAAVAVPVSVVAATGGVAGAAAPTGVQLDHLHCTTESTTASFSVPFSATGVTGGQQQMTTITGTISGCTVTSGPVAIPGTITGTISGTLATGKPASTKHPAGMCASLANGTVTKEKGTLTVTWSGDPLVNGLTSSTKVKSISGGALTVGGIVYGGFTVNGKALKTNIFQGTDKGASGVASSMTVMQGAPLLAQCTSTGLSSIALQAQPTGLTFG